MVVSPRAKGVRLRASRGEGEGVPEGKPEGGARCDLNESPFETYAVWSPAQRPRRRGRQRRRSGKCRQVHFAEGE